MKRGAVLAAGPAASELKKDGVKFHVIYAFGLVLEAFVNPSRCAASNE
jgi:hypothetical protein